jgi:hypothetical protein
MYETGAQPLRYLLRSVGTSVVRDNDLTGDAMIAESPLGLFDAGGESFRFV